MRHYDRGGEIIARYITEDNSTCLRPPAAGAALGPPGWGGAYAGTKPPCLASHDLSAKEEEGVCDKGMPMWQKSGHWDGPDWDIKDAYKGGATPDWHAPDPAVTGKGAKVFPYNKFAD